jgi:nicotinamidase-related amidase
MTLPKTVQEMFGEPQTPSALKNAAIVLIDIQREYLDGALPLKDVRRAATEAARLIELAAKQDVPVFHIVHAGPVGGPLFNPEGPYFAELPEVAAKPGDRVIRKSLPNAFAGTNLHVLLQETGRSELILAGCMTHVCVSTTARAAKELGYRNTVVAWACATRDLPDAFGEVISADLVQRAALSELKDGFSIVVADASTWAF